MIRRLRPAEPAELTEERGWRIAREILHPSSHPGTEEGYNHAAARVALHRAQRGRCAYCGVPLEAHYYDIEHFRPRSPYWWLTWTWENLWLACPVCQGKSNVFDLETGARLPPPSIADLQRAFALHSEHPSLLDPAIDSPERHLQCQRMPANQGGGWFWWGTSTRGHYTRGALKLLPAVRKAHYERLQQHLRRRVEPAVQRTIDAIAAGDLTTALTKWTALERAFLWRTATVEADHLVPTWWYLKAAFDSHDLASRGLRMWPYPDDAGRAGPQVVPGVGASDPSTRATTAQLYRRYLRGVARVPPAHLQDAVVAVCADQPSTVRRLSAELQRSESTIRGALSPLRAAIRLQVRPGSRPHIYEVP